MYAVELGVVALPGSCLEMENGWQQMPPAVPLLCWMNRDELPMSVAAGSTSSIAVRAIAPMTTVVSTAVRSVSISAAMAVAAHAGVAVTTAGVTVAAIGVSVSATKVAVAASGVAIAIEAVATAGVAIVVKASTVASSIETIVGEAAIVASIETTSAAGEAVSTTAIVAVVPRAGADKDTADKVVGAVESIRRASVRVIVVVTVGANGSYADVARAHSNADRNLSLGVTCRKHEKGK